MSFSCTELAGGDRQRTKAIVIIVMNTRSHETSALLRLVPLEDNLQKESIK